MVHCRQPFWKTFWLGILGGLYLSMGCTLFDPRIMC